MEGLLERALERMTPNDRQIVDLHYRSGLTRKEISERLDLPMEVVHARCDRTRSRLREALSRHFTTVALSRMEKETVGMKQVRDLRPAFRQVIVTKHLRGLSDREAALHLQLPEATFRARLQSAYEILRCDASADFSKARGEYEAEKSAAP
jgi:DNA-directed RNA polymerase specialized sigma24 family protein